MDVENVSNEECPFERSVARDGEAAEVESSKLKLEGDEKPKTHP
jgi:hypothetical protein